jgi:adenylate kinase family enzyme
MTDPLPAPRKIWVFGVAGSGKSYVAERLAEGLGVRATPLDELFWEPDWKIRDADDFRRLVDDASSGDTWVVDGQYPTAVEGFLRRADCVYWIDPPFRTSYPRLVRRTFRRLFSREEFCGGNTESYGSVFGRKSMLWLALRYHRQQRATISDMLAKHVDARARTVHVTRQSADLDRLLARGGSTTDGQATH